MGCNGGWSLGTKACLVLAAVVAVYVIGGIFYNYRIREVEEDEERSLLKSYPHHEYWMVLPS